MGAKLTPSGSFEVEHFKAKLVYTAGKFGIDDQEVACWFRSL